MAFYFFLSEDNLSQFCTDGCGRGDGFGFAVGAVANIPIINTITFNPELNLIRRGFDMGGYDPLIMREFAISVPALFQYMPFGGPVFYIEAGIQLDIPFARETTRKLELFNIYEYEYSYRDVFFGIPFGIGWHINKHFVLDCRVTIDLLAYGESIYRYNYREPEYEELGLLQSELSLLYLF